jgi:poly(beta-D-mannuronate) lyase
MQYKCVIFLACCFFTQAFANTYRTSSIAEANNLLNTQVKPGDTVVLKTGVYTDAVLAFHAIGEKQQPVVFCAEKRGSVVFNGNSSLSFSGEYLVVDGFVWKEGGRQLGTKSVIEFKTSSQKLARFSTVQHCTIDDYNIENLGADNKWISVYGYADTIRNCLLKDKRNLGATLTVWLVDGAAAAHMIESNYFLNRWNGPNADNGLESVRIGDSKTSMTNAYCTVQYNLFEACDGEIEIISNKSCYNKYIGNTFYGNDGGLTLRHGNYCLVEGNFFIGNGKSLSYGVRVIGEGHVVKMNYLEGLKGAGRQKFRAPLNVLAGVPSSPLNGYFQVKGALLESNIVLDCEGPAIRFGAGKTEAVLPPVQVVVNKNQVIFLRGTNTGVVEYLLPGTEVVYTNNTYTQADAEEKGWLRMRWKLEEAKSSALRSMEQAGYRLLSPGQVGPAYTN